MNITYARGRNNNVRHVLTSPLPCVKEVTFYYLPTLTRQAVRPSLVGVVITEAGGGNDNDVDLYIDGKARQTAR